MSALHIVIDLRWIRHKRIDGISEWSINLLDHLLKKDDTSSYTLIFQNPERRDFVLSRLSTPPGSRVNVHYLNYPVLGPRDFICASRAINRLRVDTLLSVGQPIFHPFRRYRLLEIVYDIIPLTHRHLYKKSKLKTKLFFSNKLFSRFCLQRADLLLAISDTTKDSLVSFLGLDESKIEVIYPGLNARYTRPAASSDALRSKYGLPQKYILFIGRFDPMKNIGLLLKAYAGLAQQVRREFNLVLAGSKNSEYFNDIQGEIRQLGIEAEVCCPGYIEEQDLPALYRASSLFAFPSTVEGFGLPVLEAMACGTPVVISNTGALLEVAAGAAAVMPEKPASMEQKAPVTNATDVLHSPRINPSNRKTAAIKITRMEYSFFKKAMAPSCIIASSSCINGVPLGCFLT